MYKVELYGRVRRAVLVEGRSQRAVAREFGLSRESVGKMLRYSVPPGYQRQQAVKRPKLGPWLGVIDAILEEDKRHPADPTPVRTRSGEYAVFRYAPDAILPANPSTSCLSTGLLLLRRTGRVLLRP
jgi:hypothetical protein